MPEYKNQHYVPKFYFKSFSLDGKAIELYNLKRKQNITTPINPMCQKDYFYGKDGDVEKSLSPLESGQSQIINLIISTQNLPKEQKDYFNLLGFICLQHSRTESSKIKANDSMKLLSDEITKSLFGKDADHEIVFPAIHLLKMQYSLQSIPLLGDLVPVILVNKTQTDFVFSDNPVVFQNTYFNYIANLGVLGLQSPGLQIFCPLNPKIMVMLYDPKFYVIPLGATNSIEINNSNDVEQLNILQFLNCNQNIFFSQKSQKSELEKIHLNVEHLVGQRKMKQKIIPHPISKDKEFIHSYEDKPQYDLKLSFVTLRNAGLPFEMMRSPKMVSLIKNHIKTYEKLQSSSVGKLIYNVLVFFKRLKYHLTLIFES